MEEYNKELKQGRRGGETGADFVKKIKPIGCVLFLLFSATVTILCFTVRFAPVNGYTAPETSEYYAEYPEELVSELEESLGPEISGFLSCRLDGETVVVTAEKGRMDAVKKAVTYYYDESLFVFEEAAVD